MNFFRTTRAVTVLTLCCLAGCSGGGAGRKDVYPVSGKITLSGGPVANAIVMFSPTAGQPVATGRTDETGFYELTTYDPGDGAAVGEYVVLVIKEAPAAASSGPPGGHDPNNPSAFRSPSHGSGRQATASKSTSTLPAKYGKADQSDLRAKVEPRDNELNFDLKL